jgi:hypothetical protein
LKHVEKSPITLVVKALYDSRYSWSAGSSGGPRTHGQCSDDELVMMGSSGEDERYDGLQGQNSPIRVLIANDKVAGLALSNPFQTKNMVRSEVKTYAGAYTVDIDEYSDSFLSTTGIVYGLAMRTMPYGFVTVAINLNYSDYRWLENNRSTFFTVDKEYLVFNSQNWNIPQKVTVKVYDDEIARLESSYVIEVFFRL